MLTTLAAGLAAVLASGWEIGTRSPAAPAQLEEFAFMVGCFRADAQLYDAERGAFGPTAPTYWTGQWALGGWAIYDEWFDVQIPGQPPALGRGGNLRMVDPETGVWTMVWVHTGGRPGQDLRAEMRGDRMVMWQIYPTRGSDWKAEFEVVDPDHWVRTEYGRPSASDDWRPLGRIHATRVSCDEVSVPGSS